MYRVLQVAASRPMLRILQPKIYTHLGSLIRDLVAVSDSNDLPWWDTDPILSALETALEKLPSVKQHAKVMNQTKKKRSVNNRCQSATKVRSKPRKTSYPTDKDTVLKIQSKTNTLNVYIPFRT